MARIPSCCGCGVGWRYSSDLTPTLGTSICCRCGPKNTKKKKKGGWGRLEPVTTWLQDPHPWPWSYMKWEGSLHLLVMQKLWIAAGVVGLRKQGEWLLRHKPPSSSHILSTHYVLVSIRGWGREGKSVKRWIRHDRCTLRGFLFSEWGADKYTNRACEK